MEIAQHLVGGRFAKLFSVKSILNGPLLIFRRPILIILPANLVSQIDAPPELDVPQNIGLQYLGLPPRNSRLTQMIDILLMFDGTELKINSEGGYNPVTAT